MLRSVHTSPDTPTDHVRHLLDKRRLDIPDDRFSTLSQFSDTPSVYSPAYFSPRDHGPFDTASYSSDYRHAGFKDTNISTLDLEDDPRSSISVSESYEDDTHSFEEDDNDDGEGESRMSYLGPKMRFHSRAPWELEAEGIPEENEELPQSPKHHGFPFSLSGAHKAPNSTGSSSPRPSGDSYRFNIPPKRSFDTINSQLSSKGALYALAQESLSSASLSRPAQKDGLFGKLSTLGRNRSYSTNNPSLPSSPVISSPQRSPLSPRLGKASRELAPDQRGDSVYEPLSPNRSRFATDRTSSSTEGAVHPYANPDLLVTTEPDTGSETTCPSPHSQSIPLRNDSSVTVTQKFVAEPVTSRTSFSSLAPPGVRNRISSIQGREISSPVAFQGSSLPPEVSGQALEGKGVGVAHLPGWTEKFVPPAFNLISLEEARAQRGRNSTVEEESVHASVSSQSNATQNTDDGPYGRARGRTISAGTKAKNAFHSMVGSVITERRDSEPAIVPSQVQNVSHQPPKPLRHRKSGFMRIFNSGKDKEPDLPPPVPSIPSDSNLPKKASRVPVPSMAQSLSDSTSSRESDLARNNLASSIDSTGHKRAPPTLHINTASQGQLPMSQQSRTTGSVLSANPTKPWLNDNMPQSAPADVSAFPALKLRPVSGLFSSHFEHIVPDLQSTSSQSEVMTPTTAGSNGPIFPVTPSRERFSNDIHEQQAAKSGREQSASPSQRRVNELEAQVRSLKAELQELRSKQDGAYCGSCGRGGSQVSPARDGSSSSGSSSSSRHSVVNRPRAKTGSAARFVNALA